MKDSSIYWEEVHRYCEQHSDVDPPLLLEIERYAHNHTMRPRMLSGRLQGRFLSMISKMIKPDIIVEIGTYVGYSALCLAEGLSDSGELHTYEVNDELEDFLLEKFAQSEYEERIHLHIGDALQLLPSLARDIDMAFIDAGKKDYDTYYEIILSKMNPGGVILLDNVLWSGKVLHPGADKTTLAIQQLNEKLSQDNRVEKMILPLRDGIFMVRKKDE